MIDRSESPSPSPRRQLHSARPVAVLMVAFALGLAAGCAPGSSGTGYPDAPAGNAPPPAPAPSDGAPAPAPPPTVPSAPDCAAPSPSVAGGDPAALAEATAPYQGTVRALDSDCLMVGERWIALGQATIVTRAGVAADRTALVAGTLVTVEPDPADPRRATRIVIE